MTAHRAASQEIKEFHNWNPQLLSSDSEIAYELERIKARTRDLERNNGVAAGLSQTYIDNIVGNQFRLSAKPDYKALGRDLVWAKEWQKFTESKFRSWANGTECDATRMSNFHGLTKIVLNSVMGAGEAIALPLWMRSRQVKTTIMLVDPDRLSTPDYQLNTERLREGVEISKYGEPLAYHIMKHHPGDFFTTVGAVREWERIPARTRFGRKRVLHMFDKKRIGQNRSKPVITSIIDDFKMLDTYQRYELKSQITNSMVAAFIETTMGGDQLSQIFNGNFEEYADDRKQWEAQLEGGSIIPMYPGDRMQAFKPDRPGEAYGSFIESMWRNMAAGANIPYEILMKDFSKVNYSSARAAILEAWRFFMGQRKFLKDWWATPVYDLWLEEMVNTGQIEAPGFYQNRQAYTRCDWIGGGRGWVDEEKEAKAANTRINSTLSTLEKECALQGEDYEEVLEQRGLEIQLQSEIEERLGVKFPSSDTSGNAAQDDTASEEDSEDEDEDTEDDTEDDTEEAA